MRWSGVMRGERLYVDLVFAAEMAPLEPSASGQREGAGVRNGYRAKRIHDRGQRCAPERIARRLLDTAAPTAQVLARLARYS